MKTDPEGRGTVLVVKSTGDVGCPVGLLRFLLSNSKEDGPLFQNLNFIPTQPWLCAWIRERMRELGKDPRWYSLRSIRQGESSTACECDMPDVFLKATGG